MKKNKVYFFQNGNVAAFDKDGVQIPKLQINVIRKWLEMARKKGFDVTKMELNCFHNSVNHPKITKFEGKEYIVW